MAQLKEEKVIMKGFTITKHFPSCKVMWYVLGVLVVQQRRNARLGLIKGDRCKNSNNALSCDTYIDVLGVPRAVELA